MDAWSRKTLTFLEMLAFLDKGIAVKFSKFCSGSFHRLTERCVMCKFREIWPTENRWNRALLAWLSSCRPLHGSLSKSASEMYSIYNFCQWWAWQKQNGWRRNYFYRVSWVNWHSDGTGVSYITRYGHLRRLLLSSSTYKYKYKYIPRLMGYG